MNVVDGDRLIHCLKILRAAHFHAANRGLLVQQGQCVDARVKPIKKSHERDVSAHSQRIERSLKIFPTDCLQNDIGSFSFCEQMHRFFLLLRSKRGVALTASGEAFLEEARSVLAQTEKAIQSAQRATTPKRITIGFSMCAFDRLLPQVVQAFRLACPDVEITLTEMITPNQVEALLKGEISVGFLHLPINAPELITKIILSDVLVVALPETHALAKQSSISLKSLKREPLVICPKAVKPEFYEQVIQLCQAAGFEPNIVQEVTPPEAAIAFVAAGTGISLVASHYQTKQNAGVVYLPLEELVPLEIAIAWHRDNHSEVLRQFLAVIEDSH